MYGYVSRMRQEKRMAKVIKKVFLKYPFRWIVDLCEHFFKTL